MASWAAAVMYRTVTVKQNVDWVEELARVHEHVLVGERTLAVLEKLGGWLTWPASCESEQRLWESVVVAEEYLREEEYFLLTGNSTDSPMPFPWPSDGPHRGPWPFCVLETAS